MPISQDSFVSALADSFLVEGKKQEDICFWPRFFISPAVVFHSVLDFIVWLNIFLFWSLDSLLSLYILSCEWYLLSNEPLSVLGLCETFASASFYGYPSLRRPLFWLWAGAGKLCFCGLDNSGAIFSHQCLAILFSFCFVSFEPDIESGASIGLAQGTSRTSFVVQTGNQFYYTLVWIGSETFAIFFSFWIGQRRFSLFSE